MNRRNLLIGSLAAAGAAQGQARPAGLKCKADGTFTILMISDLHYRLQRDEYGIALAGKLIEKERPDVVIVAGDCLTGKDCRTPAEVATAVSHVAEAMEKARVPWAVTFGNHDQEHAVHTRLDKEQVMRLYERYPGNPERRVGSGRARGWGTTSTSWCGTRPAAARRFSRSG